MDLPQPALVALAAKVVGRPLRLEWRRQQVYAIGGHRPAQRHRLRIGAEPDGRMRTLHHWTRQHSSMISGYTEYGSRMTKMMYAVPELGFTNALAHLNLPSPSVMRGPGFLTGGWALETALNELACELGVDPMSCANATMRMSIPIAAYPSPSSICATVTPAESGVLAGIDAP